MAEDPSSYPQEFINQVRDKLIEAYEKTEDKTVFDNVEYQKWLSDDILFR